MVTSLMGRIAAVALLVCAGMASASATVAKTSGATARRTEAQGKRIASFEQFIAAVHKVETMGRTGMILGDSLRSLGPLQISQKAWQDAISFDRSIGGKYSDCKHLSYSIKVLRAYLNRYDPDAVKRGDWEACARLWNSGPTWYLKTRLTNKYWAQVRLHLVRSQTT